MTNKACFFVLYLALVVLVCTRVFAADSDNGVLTFSGQPSWAIATNASLVTPATIPDSSKLYTIYSNLGPKYNAYYQADGYVVQGPGAQGGQQWMAMPFTPKNNAEVTLIETAVQYYSGEPNAVVISLNEDSSGLPGNPIHTWSVKNLPNVGTCCKLDISKSTKGLKVKKGTQYWIVASTNSNEEGTSDLWDFTYDAETGPHAFNQGKGWESGSPAQLISAFGVFGKKTN